MRNQTRNPGAVCSTELPHKLTPSTKSIRPEVLAIGHCQNKHASYDLNPKRALILFQCPRVFITTGCRPPTRC